MILIKCAIGHIPSTRRIGDITTPKATIIARNTWRKTRFSFFISTYLLFAFLKEYKQEAQRKQLFRLISQDRSKPYSFLSACLAGSLAEVLCTVGAPLPYAAIKKRYSKRRPYLNMFILAYRTQFPTSALSESGYGSKRALPLSRFQLPFFITIKCYHGSKGIAMLYFLKAKELIEFSF